MTTYHPSIRPEIPIDSLHIRPGQWLVVIFYHSNNPKLSKVYTLKNDGAALRLIEMKQEGEQPT